MKTGKISQLWVQGLLMAAVIAVAVPMPEVALAQLSTTVDTSQQTVFNPVLKVLSFACYVIGGVLGVAGIMKFKQHSENPTNAPLSHGFSRVGAGAALLALPFLMGVFNQTARQTLSGTSTFTPFGF